MKSFDFPALSPSDEQGSNRKVTLNPNPCSNNQREVAEIFQRILFQIDIVKSISHTKNRPFLLVTLSEYPGFSDRAKTAQECGVTPFFFFLVVGAFSRLQLRENRTLVPRVGRGGPSHTNTTWSPTRRAYVQEVFPNI